MNPITEIVFAYNLGILNDVYIVRKNSARKYRLTIRNAVRITSLAEEYCTFWRVDYDTRDKSECITYMFGAT